MANFNEVLIALKETASKSSENYKKGSIKGCDNTLFEFGKGETFLDANPHIMKHGEFVTEWTHCANDILAEDWTINENGTAKRDSWTNGEFVFIKKGLTTISLVEEQSTEEIKSEKPTITEVKVEEQSTEETKES